MIGIANLDVQWQAVIRSVSKNGDFFLASEEVDAMRKTLSDEEAVILYLAIRDYSYRLEDEWRNLFIDAFPGSEHLLPPSLQ